MKKSPLKWKPHWKKLQRKKQMNPIGKRRRIESRIRNKQWPEFLEKHPRCEIKSPVCTGLTQCRHHLRGRLGKLFLDEKNQVASCNACNEWFKTADGYRWGKENKFVLDRIGNL